MTKHIGGLMDYSKLMPAQPAVAPAESGSGIPVQHRPLVAAYDQLAAQDFHNLTHDEQHAAIHGMAAAGHDDSVIARATGLSTEMVRRLLAEHEAQP